MEGSTQLPLPEDEEDLEALRLAALQSLKKKSQGNHEMQPFSYYGGVKDKIAPFNVSPRGKHKRGKFARSLQGRGARNGQFNGWTRNSNLIAVPMVTEEKNVEETTPEDIPKLVLPQDRYCKTDKSDKPDEKCESKFDRYDNSDDSESESEEESSCKSDTEENSLLNRSNSLEDLMAELENEIQGGGAPKPKEEKPKTRPKKKRKISVNVESEDNKPETKPLKENLKPETAEIKPQIETKKPPQSNFARQRKWQNKPRRHNNTANFVPQNIMHQPPPPVIPEIIPSVVPFPPPPLQTFPPYNPINYDGGVYVAPPVIFEAPPPQLPPLHVAPPAVYERPLSPLTINTEAFSTSTLAPLSPRSAAFVLENRAIIEKRRRRSYSRSPSPLRFRRSKSPKRSSLSPKRVSKSPKRCSLSPSPIRKVLPPKKPASIHDRLGIKSNKTESDEKDRPKKDEKKPEVLDPILEARRKKFERNEITMKEGVIRLKKEEAATIEEEKKKQSGGEEEEEDEDIIEEIDEDALLEEEGDDTLLLNHKIDTLFSDEESDSDNEGRFKTKQESNQKVAILPFAKLVNGAKSDVKSDLKTMEERRNLERAKSARKRYRSRTPLKSVKRVVKAPKKSEKTKSLGFPIDSRKIEIKIRNPGKYEKVETAKSGESGAPTNRKVEITKKTESEENTSEAADETAEQLPPSTANEGDLRAQLSRKRAERQKHPLPDVVPSRLLQNALQGVGFRKGKKTKSKEENTEGKLPIHMRLGAANGSEFSGKKSRKHKNKGSQEQV